jgi:beta-galactosidase
MGNGPGGLQEYIELFRTEPLSQGGLVWEWSNHGLLKREGNLTYFGYGGDFGDEPNDADFVMDGLTLSDHTPMPSLLEYAKIIQPVSVDLAEDGSQMVVTNHYAFVDLSALDVVWFLVQDGETTEPERLDLPRVPAGENRTVQLPLDPSSLSQEAWLTIEFRLNETKPWAEQGYVVAWDQLHLTGPRSLNTKRSTSHLYIHSVILPKRQLQESSFELNQNGPNLTVTAGDTTFGFDLLQGNVTWNANGVDILQRGPELVFYRAMTQNDEGSNGDMAEWDEAQVGTMHMQVRDVYWDTSDDEVTVHYKVRVAPMVLEWGVEADLVYTVSSDSPTGGNGTGVGNSTTNESSRPSLRIHATGAFVGNNTPSVVPRIGLQAILPSSFNSVTWFGRGPGENYKDSKQACRIGEYTSSVEDLFTHYDYPQENGNREDLRWLRVSNEDENVTLDARRFTTDENPTFSFTAGRYLPWDLNDAKHPHELEPLDFTVLNLDYDNHGLGSASVGPKPFEQYKCRTEDFEFGFVLSVV